MEPADPPSGFQGSLRPYQCIGLGWVHFLERFGFGGCLADDMGLGKTVQALALPPSYYERLREDYTGRRDLFLAYLDEAGLVPALTHERRLP